MIVIAGACLGFVWPLSSLFMILCELSIMESDVRRWFLSPFWSLDVCPFVSALAD